jgi:hypothetical protein
LEVSALAPLLEKNFVAVEVADDVLAALGVELPRGGRFALGRQLVKLLGAGFEDFPGVRRRR